MTWLLVATFILALGNPHTRVPDGPVGGDGLLAQPSAAEIVLQAAGSEAAVTRTVGPEGAMISVDFGGASRQVFFPAGSLLREVSVTVKLSETPEHGVSG